LSANPFDALVKVSGPVSRETFSVLEQFVTAFQRWNKVTNLAAASTMDEIWSRHVLDSAQLLKLQPQARRWVDLGSGGGFPGLILAILRRDSPGFQIDLIESNQKKAAFLHAMIGELRLPAKARAKRIEDIHDAVDKVEVVTSRALAPLNKLLQLSEPWLSAGAVALFHKGRGYRQEIQESSHAWRFDLLEHPSAVESQSVILEISDLARI
jgi:16S rRNA (guanine527-N7)-methyltransferase